MVMQLYSKQQFCYTYSETMAVERVHKNGYINHTEVCCGWPTQNVCIARCMLDHSKDLLIARGLIFWTTLVHSCSEACTFSDSVQNSSIPQIRCQSHYP